MFKDILRDTRDDAIRALIRREAMLRNLERAALKHHQRRQLRLHRARALSGLLLLRAAALPELTRHDDRILIACAGLDGGWIRISHLSRRTEERTRSRT